MQTFRFRTIFLVLGLITLLCLLAPVIIGLASAALTYDGTCHGFTDGSSNCSGWQYAQNEIFLGSILTFTPAIFLGLGWLITLGFWVAKQFQPEGKTLPAWQIALIPLLACLVGAIFLSVFPFLAGFRQ